MALLTKKEFAGRCGWPTNQLSVYITRGKVLLGANDLIDTSDDRNRAFLQKHSVSDIDIPPAPSKKARPSKKVLEAVGDEGEPTEDPDEIPQLFQSERKLKFLDTKKREREIEKLQLDNDKKRGEVIPSEMVKPIFLQHNQSIITAFKNAADDIIRIMAKKKGLNPNEIAEMKGSLITSINEAIKKATASTIASVDTVIGDFSVKRGVGERT